jgi:hypothetical protein
MIADALTERYEHKTFQISGFWADYGQSAPYCLLLQPESPCGRGPLNLASSTIEVADFEEVSGLIRML